MRGPVTRRKRRTQEERSSDTTSALVEAAISALCELGYAGITTSEIARRAKCTTGAMQHHFGSKEDLLLAVLERLSTEFGQTYASFARFAKRPIEERSNHIVDSLWKYYEAPRYLAIWELYVGTRCDPPLHKICIRNRAQVLAACERAWLSAFSDLDADRQVLVDIMIFAITVLRSIGLNNALGTTPDLNGRQRKLLKEVVASKLAAFRRRPAA